MPTLIVIRVYLKIMKEVKMTLQDHIIKDMTAEIGKAKVNTMLQCLRVIVGEMQREKDKELDDNKVISILRKLEKSEIEFIETGGYGQDNTDTESNFLKVVRWYLPKPTTAQEVIDFIYYTIDFSLLKNKMEAIGLVKKHFGEAVDGKMVKQIVMDL